MGPMNNFWCAFSFNKLNLNSLKVRIFFAKKLVAFEYNKNPLTSNFKIFNVSKIKKILNSLQSFYINYVLIYFIDSHILIAKNHKISTFDS